ncbi:hypothetical protein C8R46DRAFT_1347255 [Mycena filopes]|nr:hypothetical protein C8R46DRAFT_1347255 [Mycena filopes]
MPILLPRAALELIAEYGKREAPRIGGSEGGFIGLVVGLGVIILISCVAIYILLRDHSPSQRDREARRHGHEPRYPSEASSLKERIATLGGMFGGGGRGADGSKRASKSGHGWIQASGDAWEADEVERSREMSGFVNAKDAPFSPPVDPYAADSASYSTYDPPSSHIRFEEPIPRSTSPESTVTYTSPTQNESRQFSGESTTSTMRTFSGGTKFIEGL